MINVRQKGQEGEREVAKALNAVIAEVLKSHGIPPPPKDVVQRNQNQSAVGGSDLSNTFTLAIEIKRQEVLSVNTWWAQCEKSAKENPGDIPVLIYRQNKQKWRVRTYGDLPLPQDQGSVRCVVEFSWEDFLRWFYHWVDKKLINGEMPRV